MEATSSAGPLQGVRVLDFTHGVAGPYSAMLLGDLGADVIRVEPIGGESLRTLSYSERFDANPRVGGDYFLALNRNKRSVTVNLRVDEGRETVKRMAEQADVILQSFRPGVMEKLGLGFGELSAVNPRLVYGSISGYGTSGPLSAMPSNDLALQARSGMLSITGSPGGRPVKLGGPVPVLSAGVHLSNAVVAALFHRERTGIGQQVDVSILDATMAMLTNFAVAVVDGGFDVEPTGSSHPGLSPFEAFPTSDGDVVISAGNDRFFANLCAGLGLEHLLEDARFSDNRQRVTHRAALTELISDVTQTRPTAHWVTALTEADVPVSPVNTVRDAFGSEQVAHNRMIVEVEHPEIGPLHVIGIPYKYSETHCDVRLAPPRAGEHSVEVLTELLGLTESDVARLQESGALGAL